MRAKTAPAREGSEGDGAGGEGFFRALDDGAVGEASSTYVVGDIVADMWEGKKGDSFLSGILRWIEILQLQLRYPDTTNESLEKASRQVAA